MDSVSFEQAFRRYFKSVAYFFSQRGLTPEECHDLTQETFLRIYRGLDEFRQDSRLETWIFTIATNVWLNSLRHRSAGKREGEEISFEAARESDEAFAPSAETWRVPHTGPLENLLNQEQIDLLRMAIKDLPSQMRCCLLFRLNQDLKYREIAELMDISIETVKSQLFQAKEQLRIRLSAYHDYSSLGVQTEKQEL